MNTHKLVEKNLSRRFWLGAQVVILAALSVQVSADPITGVTADSLLRDSLESNPFSDDQYSDGNESRLDGWAVSFDNDILVPSSRDQDYTYGVALTLAGSKVSDYWATPFRPLGWLNKQLGLRTERSGSRQSLEFGAYGFTPEDISIAEANAEDRPYASLVYATAIQDFDTSRPNVSWRTSLTLGALGLNFVGDAQNAVHDITDSQRANGWRNQISEGGEITARYSIARQQVIPTRFSKLELKTTAQASVGYLTEASYGVSVRYGNIASGWKSFNPGLANYREQANQSVDQLGVSESYWTFGATFRARAYNAFLQGQFRDSAVTFSRDELNIGIVEAWAGYTTSIGSYRLSYLLRGHTSEVRDGIADRDLLWGGLTISRVF